jgi:hypothetical protein
MKSDLARNEISCWLAKKSHLTSNLARNEIGMKSDLARNEMSCWLAKKSYLTRNEI